MDLLRFITIGNVDDGKSTLIGRLLYDSRSVSTDVMEAIVKSGRHNGTGTVDLSLLTDGLRAEREQGITIDVAYKYFTTPKRKFILADAPGHFQYTKNMVTGASNADLAIILIDARNGVAEQTTRHAIIASLLGISHLVVCVNKIDLTGYSEKVFREIVEQFNVLAKKLEIKDIIFIPVSALFGDNIVEKSEHTSWYYGKTLLNHLENVSVENDVNHKDSRFPVQYIIRPNSHDQQDYRGYAGKIISGVYKKGDAVTVLPSGFQSKIKIIELSQKEIEEAFAQQSVVIHLEDDIDISRGDMIVKNDNLPEVEQEIRAVIFWMDAKPLIKGMRLLVQQNSRISKGIIGEIEYKINISSFENETAQGKLSLNEIGFVRIKTAQPLIYDSYKKNRAGGSFILIDENTNETVGAGLIQ